MPQRTFFLLIQDLEHKEFMIAGPMHDDLPWNEAIIRLQAKGRKMNCCTIGDSDRLPVGSKKIRDGWTQNQSLVSLWG